MSYGAVVRMAAGIVATFFLLPSAIPAGAQTQPLIRLGLSISDATAEGYYAQQLGFFKKAGLNVELRPLRTSATIATGVATGTIDIGISNIPALAREIARGTPLVLIAGGGLYSTSDPVTALCVGNRSQLRGPTDLVGKTIAVAALGAQSDLSTMAWLEHSHVDESQVHFIAIPYVDMTAGIENGLADAAVITEPWLSAAVRSGKLRVLAKPYDVIGPQFLIGVWFTTSKWYAEHPDVARRLVRVIYETARWANTHHEQSAKLLSQFSGIDLQTIRSMARTPLATSLDLSLVQPQLDLASKYHEIDRPINAKNLIVRDDR
jgi:NitT/TauT family transport system substrate-binding protein